MAWPPEKLTTEQLEQRRREAARLLRGGLGQAAVARRLAVSPAAVCIWARRLKRHGVKALRARPRTGRPPRLSPRQWQQVGKVLERGAVAAGFGTDRWTLQRVALLIRQSYGVRYHPNYLAEPLRTLGFSPQQPRPVARERDEALVLAWLRRDWPSIKKGLRAAGQPWPSWMRQVVRFGHGRPPPGRPSGVLRY